MTNTYEFDAMISVMADGRSQEEAADAILEHCLEADIACSLQAEGTLNIRKYKAVVEAARWLVRDAPEWGAFEELSDSLAALEKDND